MHRGLPVSFARIAHGRELFFASIFHCNDNVQHAKKLDFYAMDHANIDLLYKISHNVFNNNVFIALLYLNSDSI